MLTIFSCPKPFKGHIGTIQRNAIRSWRLLDPAIEIILVGNEEGTAKIAEEFGIRHIPDVAVNEYGTPFVRDIFHEAQKYAKFDILCYVNTDIILLKDFTDAVKRVERGQKPFLLVGQRWDLRVDELMVCTDNWQVGLREKVKASGTLHSKYAIDYFVFRGDFLEEMPPFVIGRPRWDNWVVFQARMEKVNVIDATPVVCAIHQKHDYSHIPEGDGCTYEGPEAANNRLLMPHKVCSLNLANYVLHKNVLLPALGNRMRPKWRHFHNTMMHVMKNVRGISRRKR